MVNDDLSEEVNTTVDEQTEYTEPSSDANGPQSPISETPSPSTTICRSDELVKPTTPPEPTVSSAEPEIRAEATEIDDVEDIVDDALIDDEEIDTPEGTTSVEAEEDIVEEVENYRLMPTSLYCSVPLSKDVLSIIETFSKTDDRGGKKSRKLLCLYCDRTFVAENLRQKHVDRCHSIKQARRSSSRIQQSQSTTACLFCDKYTKTDHSLNELFQHQVNEHSDKYFGCLSCEERFITQLGLDEHNEDQHGIKQEFKDVKIINVQSEVEEISDLVSDGAMDNSVKIRHKSKIKDDLVEAVEEVVHRPRRTRQQVRELRSKRISIKSTKLGIKRSARLQHSNQKRMKNGRKKQQIKEKIQMVEAKIDKEVKASTEENPYPTFDAFFRVKKITDHSIDNLRISSLTFNDVFDQAFYSRIKCNIRENLLNHLDGKLFKNEESESRISTFEKISTETIPPENYGCEVTLNAATPIPSSSLLSTQFGDDLESQIEYGSKASKKKTIIKKDEVHYKYFTRRKYQASILEGKENRDLSKLDMWTQFVIKNRQQKIINTTKSDKEKLDYKKGDEYKGKKQNEELNRILDRRGPFEDLREEANKKAALEGNFNQQANEDVSSILEEILGNIFGNVVEEIKSETELTTDVDMPDYLNLRKASINNESIIDKSDKITLICSSQETENFEAPLVAPRDKNALVELTGEWARSRLYICAACGLKVPNLRLLLDHKTFVHQNVWCQHYEFVGNQGRFYKHLSIPGLGKMSFVEENPIIKVWRRSDARGCSKCKKQCNSLGELHRHVLECGEDWSWMMVRKKCKYRPFGAKTRKKRRGLFKSIINSNKDKTNCEKRKYNVKSRLEGPRPKPSDAETIQRMLANLPAKRATRKIMSLKDGFPSKHMKNSSSHDNKTTNAKSKKNIQIRLRRSRAELLIHEGDKLLSSRRKVINSRTGVKCNPVTNLRQSVRNLNKVISSKLIDTANTLLVKRKLKNVLNQQRFTRRTRQMAENRKSGVEEMVEDTVTGENVKETKEEIVAVVEKTRKNTLLKNLRKTFSRKKSKIAMLEDNLSENDESTNVKKVKILENTIESSDGKKGEGIINSTKENTDKESVIGKLEKLPLIEAVPIRKTKKSKELEFGALPYPKSEQNPLRKTRSGTNLSSNEKDDFLVNGKGDNSNQSSVSLPEVNSPAKKKICKKSTIGSKIMRTLSLRRKKPVKDRMLETEPLKPSLEVLMLNDPKQESKDPLEKMLPVIIPLEDKTKIPDKIEPKNDSENTKNNGKRKSKLGSLKNAVKRIRLTKKPSASEEYRTQHTSKSFIKIIGGHFLEEGSKENNTQTIKEPQISDKLDSDNQPENNSDNNLVVQITVNNSTDLVNSAEIVNISEDLIENRTDIVNLKLNSETNEDVTKNREEMLESGSKLTDNLVTNDLLVNTEEMFANNEALDLSIKSSVDLSVKSDNEVSKIQNEITIKPNKLCKRTKGLHACIAMLTSKLHPKPDKIISEKGDLSFLSSNESLSFIEPNKSVPIICVKNTEVITKLEEIKSKEVNELPLPQDLKIIQSPKNQIEEMPTTTFEDTLEPAEGTEANKTQEFVMENASENSSINKILDTIELKKDALILEMEKNSVGTELPESTNLANAIINLEENIVETVKSIANIRGRGRRKQKQKIGSMRKRTSRLSKNAVFVPKSVETSTAKIIEVLNGTDSKFESLKEVVSDRLLIKDVKDNFQGSKEEIRNHKIDVCIQNVVDNYSEDKINNALNVEIKDNLNINSSKTKDRRATRKIGIRRRLPKRKSKNLDSTNAEAPIIALMMQEKSGGIPKEDKSFEIKTVPREDLSLIPEETTLNKTEISSKLEKILATPTKLKRKYTKKPENIPLRNKLIDETINSVIQDYDDLKTNQLSAEINNLEAVFDSVIKSIVPEIETVLEPAIEIGLKSIKFIKENFAESLKNKGFLETHFGAAMNKPKAKRGRPKGSKQLLPKKKFIVPNLAPRKKVGRPKKIKPAEVIKESETNTDDLVDVSNSKLLPEFAENEAELIPAQVIPENINLKIKLKKEIIGKSVSEDQSLDAVQNHEICSGNIVNYMVSDVKEIEDMDASRKDAKLDISLTEEIEITFKDKLDTTAKEEIGTCVNVNNIANIEEKEEDKISSIDDEIVEKEDPPIRESENTEIIGPSLEQVRNEELVSEDGKTEEIELDNMPKTSPKKGSPRKSKKKDVVTTPKDISVPKRRQRTTRINYAEKEPEIIPFKVPSNFLDDKIIEIEENSIIKETVESITNIEEIKLIEETEVQKLDDIESGTSKPNEIAEIEKIQIEEIQTTAVTETLKLSTDDIQTLKLSPKKVSRKSKKGFKKITILSSLIIDKKDLKVRKKRKPRISAEKEIQLQGIASIQTIPQPIPETVVIETEISKKENRTSKLNYLEAEIEESFEENIITPSEAINIDEILENIDVILEQQELPETPVLDTVMNYAEMEEESELLEKTLFESSPILDIKNKLPKINSGPDNLGINEISKFLETSNFDNVDTILEHKEILSVSKKEKRMPSTKEAEEIYEPELPQNNLIPIIVDDNIDDVVLEHKEILSVSKKGKRAPRINYAEFEENPNLSENRIVRNSLVNTGEPLVSKKVKKASRLDYAELLETKIDPTEIVDLTDKELEFKNSEAILESKDVELVDDDVIMEHKEIPEKNKPIQQSTEEPNISPINILEVPIIVQNGIPKKSKKAIKINNTAKPLDEILRNSLISQTIETVIRENTIENKIIPPKKEKRVFGIKYDARGTKVILEYGKESAEAKINVFKGTVEPDVYEIVDTDVPDIIDIKYGSMNKILVADKPKGCEKIDYFEETPLEEVVSDKLNDFVALSKIKISSKFNVSDEVKADTLAYRETADIAKFNLFPSIIPPGLSPKKNKSKSKNKLLKKKSKHISKILNEELGLKRKKGTGKHRKLKESVLENVILKSVDVVVSEEIKTADISDNIKSNLELENEPDILENKSFANDSIAILLNNLIADTNLENEALELNAESDSEDEVPLAAFKKTSPCTVKEKISFFEKAITDSNDNPKLLDAESVSETKMFDAFEFNDTIIENLEVGAKRILKRGKAKKLKSVEDSPMENKIQNIEKSLAIYDFNESTEDKEEINTEISDNSKENMEERPSPKRIMLKRGRKPKISSTNLNSSSDLNYSDISQTESQQIAEPETFVTPLKDTKINENQNDSFIKTPDLNDSIINRKINTHFKIKQGIKTKKLKTIKKIDEIENVDTYCEICRKQFVRIENLIKHKRTLTHIAKLSEIEAIEAVEKTKLQEKPVSDDSIFDGASKDLETIQDINDDCMLIDDDIQDSNAQDGDLQNGGEYNDDRDFADSMLITSPFNLKTNNDTLKLAEIINDVLSKPDDKNLEPFSDILDQTQETKRYKSLGERKSFDSDTILYNSTKPTYNNHIDRNDMLSSKTTADSILEKQISLLENIIEADKANFHYIDEISVSSNKSEQRCPSDMSLVSDIKQDDSNIISFSHNSNLVNNLIHPKTNFIKPNQYEEISEDSLNVRNFEDQRSRKTLNRDEALFIECCSLLKSSSEISNFSKKSTRNMANNFEMKQGEERDWVERKNYNQKPKIFNRSEEFLSDNSCPNTPIGDNYDDFSDSDTIKTDWNTKLKEQQFEDISIDSVSDQSQTPNNFNNFNHNFNEDKNNSDDDSKISDCLDFTEDSNVSEFKNNIDAKFGGLMVDALKTQDNEETTIKTSSKHRLQSEITQTSITDYAIPISKKTDSDSQTNDSKKMLTKGAMKVFEGLKVSIPTDDLDMNQVLNCSPTSKRLEIENEIKEDKIPKPREISKKSNIKKFGNKLGLKITKKKLKIKKTSPGKSKKMNLEAKNKVLDIYDFEETQDNSDLFVNSNLRPFRTDKINDDKDDSLDDDLNIDDFDDKDDLISNSSKQEILDIESDSEIHNPLIDSCNFETRSLSSFSTETESSTSLKKASSIKNITKKKCVIMGRIFKNAFKSKMEEKLIDIPDEVEKSPIKALDIANVKESARSKMSTKEMDMLFDQLLEENKSLHPPQKNHDEAVLEEPFIPPLDIDKTLKSKLKMMNKVKKRQRKHSQSSDDEFNIIKAPKKRIIRKKAKEKDNEINLEQELKECIGVAGRKTQRKCTSGKQNVLVEYWSSDDSEFEAFLNETLPPIKINQNPTLTPNKPDQSIQNRESIIDDLKTAPTPVLPYGGINVNFFKEIVKDVNEAKLKARRKSISQKAHLNPVKLKTKYAGGDNSSGNRRKRSAGDTLYYWSSSSDDESGNLIEVKPLRDDNEDDDDRPMQHGWIVGDSPKKLVTMLAIAKGKKTDLKNVKEQGKKRTTTI